MHRSIFSQRSKITIVPVPAAKHPHYVKLDDTDTEEPHTPDRFLLQVSQVVLKGVGIKGTVSDELNACIVVGGLTCME